MYVPGHFAETRQEVLHQLIRDRPFATLVARTAAGLNVEHLPFLIDTTASPLGMLKGHVARANPVWLSTPPGDAIAVFHGPQGYISPAWYPTKQESGKAVPTWNFVVVHAHGPLRFIEDPAWLLDHVEQLTHQHEGDRAEPWKVSDAPPEFVSKLLGAIVGVEIPISRLEGKWKLGQNRSPGDRQGAIAGLLGENDEAAMALAALMRTYPKP